jgi:hypothetical protein
MKRLFAMALAATAAFSLPAAAEPQQARVRGTVSSAGGDMLMLHTTAGEDMSIMLDKDTHYLGVVPASIGDIAPGSFIGTATKDVGDKMVALEVVVFPPAMKGVGEGHYPWDKLPDTTMASSGKTDSTMTNGTVAVDSMMTNGDVAAASADGGAKKLTVTYKGGEQTILVPPTAPVVTFRPATLADLANGASVFAIVTTDSGKVTANVVAVGMEGAKPPM